MLVGGEVPIACDEAGERNGDGDRFAGPPVEIAGADVCWEG
jgi:hypothetical protein